jgi:hypothetical protein
MRTIAQQFEHGVPPPAGDYFVISTETSTWYVSTAMARVVEGCIDAEARPEWVTFVDLTGARVRLRVEQIEYVCQCTAEQRRLGRAFYRALKQERKADQPWDEEER